MNLIDLTLSTPAENLAADEALLDACEDGRQSAVLRFWESPECFVVVGYSNHVATEVNVEACQARGVPILRRCTGGGTVVQGPGCLNYALVLPIDRDPSLQGVVETNRYIMGRQRAALTRALGQPVTFDGHTDLALNGRKFSGNSQRRKKTHLLFHGTFLLDFDLGLISELLCHPSREPGYRARRAHGDFVTNLHRAAATIKEALCEAWTAREPLPAVPRERIDQLVADKYATAEWTWKF